MNRRAFRRTGRSPLQHPTTGKRTEEPNRSKDSFSSRAVHDVQHLVRWNSGRNIVTRNKSGALRHGHDHDFSGTVKQGTVKLREII